MGNVAQAVSLSDSELTASNLSWKKLLGWRTGILLVLIGWLYAPILASLVQQWWTDPNFSHGFFVPVFSVLLIWQNRSRLKVTPRSPSTWGLLIILLSILMLILGVFG